MIQEKLYLKGPRLDQEENSMQGIIESFKKRENLDGSMGDNLNISDYIQQEKGLKSSTFSFFIYKIMKR